MERYDFRVDYRGKKILAGRRPQVASGKQEKEKNGTHGMKKLWRKKGSGVEKVGTGDELRQEEARSCYQRQDRERGGRHARLAKPKK